MALLLLCKKICRFNIITHLISGGDPFKKTANRLSDPLVGDDGRIYTCSERNIYSFESSGTVAWAIPLNYTCNVDIAPIQDGRGKVTLILFKVLSRVRNSISSYRSVLW